MSPNQEPLEQLQEEKKSLADAKTPVADVNAGDATPQKIQI